MGLLFSASKRLSSLAGYWKSSLKLLVPIDQCFSTLVLGAPQYCTFCMSLFSDTISGPGISSNELMSWIRCVWLGILLLVLCYCQICPYLCTMMLSEILCLISPCREEWQLKKSWSWTSAFLFLLALKNSHWSESCLTQHATPEQFQY